MGYFFQGLTMGLAYVAPIGLQNLFVINSALTHTRRRALLTAWIVIFFDVTLAFACFFGIGAVMERYQWLQMVILCVGSLIVIYIGIGLLRAKAEEIDRSKTTDSVRKTISSACVVTWFNPQAIIDGTMMLGAFRATLPAGGDLPFILGFTSASFIWFNGLAIASNLLGAKINTRALTWLNRLCGAVIICYGAKLLFDLARMIFG